MIAPPVPLGYLHESYVATLLASAKMAYDKDLASIKQAYEKDLASKRQEIESTKKKIDCLESLNTNLYGNNTSQNIQIARLTEELKKAVEGHFTSEVLAKLKEMQEQLEACKAENVRLTQQQNQQQEAKTTKEITPQGDQTPEAVISMLEETLKASQKDLAATQEALEYEKSEKIRMCEEAKERSTLILRANTMSAELAALWEHISFSEDVERSAVGELLARAVRNLKITIPGEIPGLVQTVTLGCGTNYVVAVKLVKTELLSNGESKQIKCNLSRAKSSLTKLGIYSKDQTRSTLSWKIELCTSAPGTGEEVVVTRSNFIKSTGSTIEGIFCSEKTNADHMLTHTPLVTSVAGKLPKCDDGWSFNLTFQRGVVNRNYSMQNLTSSLAFYLRMTLVVDDKIWRTKWTTGGNKIVPPVPTVRSCSFTLVSEATVRSHLEQKKRDFAAAF